MDYLQQVQAKKLANKEQASKQFDLDATIQQLKEVQLASLMAGNKSSVVLADSTDFGEKIDDLNKNLTELIKDNSKAFSEASRSDKQTVATMVKDLVSSLDRIKPADNSDIKDVMNKVLNELKKDKSITVKSPDVNVSPIDLKPITEVLEAYKPPVVESNDELDLDDYMAQDLKKVEGKQYIGFVNPMGAWYIIENDIKGESLRYLFGTKDYSKHFKKANEYVYKLLNEAVNAI